jgi:hypothetical protein
VEAQGAYDLGSLGSQVEIPLVAWMYVLMFLCHFLCMERPCNEATPRTKCAMQVS